MPIPSQTPRTLRTLLPASLAVGIAVFGATLAWLAPAGSPDRRAAAPALLTAAALAAAGLALVWARRRARARLGDARSVGRRGRLELVPLGDGQAAVIFDAAPDPRVAPGPAAGAMPGEAAATAASIWSAVDAAVRAVAAEANVPVPDRPDRRPGPRGWVKRLASRLPRRRRPADFP